MKKRIRRELWFLAEHGSLISLCTVLAVFGGILLWVHGSTAAWVFHSMKIPSFVPGFTLFFLMWLLLYGLHGVVMSILLLPTGIHTGNALKTVTGYFLSYILLLAWYPLFFSVIHSVMAIVVLLAAAVLSVVLSIQNFCRFRVLIPVCFLKLLLEIYFLCATVAFVLAN